ncbi:aldehyde dehydrogenase family protein [Pseudonocardia spinosispora]|uniref:aldehyde dehydrogenase family protein n=1 Tax=Pseudonocardia spinosispora TaxID=103441 RepID=UPI0004004176|nr:aldehyde dehydrogenase family protein [Pseudonocardia spinosispora]
MGWSVDGAGGIREYRQFIDGTWVGSVEGNLFDVMSPYRGGVHARAAAGGAADADRAVTAAARAFPEWVAMPASEKQQLFLRAAELVDTHRGDLVDIVVEETGWPSRFVDFQQQIAQDMLRQAANWVYRPKGEVLESDFSGTYSMAVRRPLGVVASFTPWNGANVLGWRAVISPIAAGNTVVVKPSEEAPISAGLVMAQVADEAGFPPGVINVVTHAPGAAEAMGDVFFERPEVRCINLIGGVRTARMLAERAGRELKRSVMELGGYNTMIVLADADLDYAVRSATFGAFFYQGQVCLCTRKVIVERPVYEEFLARLVERVRSLPAGNPADSATLIGPLINDRAVRTMQSRIEDAVGKGARVVTGGGVTGRVHEPTIVVDVPVDAEADHEETFGPLLVVAVAEDAEHAVEQANRHSYGLTSSIFTGDTFRGVELADRIISGAVHVNIPTIDDETQAPVGGVRASGWGRSGPNSLDDFSDVVWVNAQSGQRQLPF